MSAKKKADRPYYTAAERMERVWDIEEIKDLMARRGYYLGNDMRREELDDLWLLEEAHRKTASFGSNLGYYVGMEEISYYYVVRHAARRQEQLDAYVAKHPEVENCRENLGMGCMPWYPVSTPMVVLADDGKTAKGMWYVIGQESVSTGEKQADCMWYTGRVAADFVKENGVWKIWHIVDSNDLCLEVGRNAEELPSKPVPGTWPAENEFKAGKPTISMLTHNSALNWSDNYPFLPEPYASFHDGVSYGPEGHPDYEEV